MVKDVVPLAWHLPLLHNVCYHCWDNYEQGTTFCMCTVTLYRSSLSSQEASKNCSYSSKSRIGWEKSTCPRCTNPTTKGMWEEGWFKNGPDQVWCGYFTLMPTYCRCSQLGFVHVREVGKNKKVGGDHSCESLLHRPKGDVENIRKINLDTCSPFDICFQVYKQLGHLKLYFCFWSSTLIHTDCPNLWAPP